MAVYNVPVKSSTGQTIYVSGGSQADVSNAISAGGYTPPPTIYLSQQGYNSKGEKIGAELNQTFMGSTQVSGPISSAQLGQQSISLPSGGGTTGGTGSAGISSLLSSALRPPAEALFDAKTNSYSMPQKTEEQDPQTSEVARRLQELKTLQDGIPQQESVFQNEQYQQAQQQRQQAMQRQNQISGQITQIVNQAQANALSVTGQGRGIPEAIIGGQQAQIYKEAAIQALPLQAQLAVAQGDVELATEHLQNITQLVSENVQNNYKYKMQLYESVKDFVSKEQATRLKQLETQENRAYEMSTYNIKRAYDFADQALKTGQTGVFNSLMNAIKDPTNPNFMDRVNAAAGQIVAEGSGGQYTPKQITAINKINENVSKNSTYSKTSSMRNYGDNVIASLSLNSGVGDIAAINQFQKVIDEGAVTRDQDVKLIQGAQSLANTLQTKIARLQRGEQLSPQLRTEMRTAVEKMYAKQVEALMKDPYISAKNREAELNGITIDDTILGELGGFTRTATPETPQSDEQAFDEVVNTGSTQGYFSRLWNSLLGN